MSWLQKLALGSRGEQYMLVGGHPISSWRMTSLPGNPILPAGQPQQLLTQAVEEVTSQSVAAV